MMKSIRLSFLFSISVLFMLGSCTQDLCDRKATYIQYDPVYLKVDEIRQDIQMLDAQPLKNPGKIYFYDHYIFINEVREGVHIIDNADPANPLPVAFIKIPGNVDMAVRCDILYADNYIDLLAIDISDPTNAQLITRTEDVFHSISQNEDLGHLVYYEESVVTEEIDCSNPQWGNPWFGRDDFILINAGVAESADGLSNNGLPNAVQGIGGSMAQFTLYDHFLYVVDEWDLKVFDVEVCEKPALANRVNVGWGIETIYPYEDKLFIGANDGMYIFDNEYPLNPRFLSKFQHARACDPVVVEGDIAYVTLRDGTTCEGFNNQLDVVDVSNLTSPRLLKTYPMNQPHGLAVRDQTLYLCDGDAGLKVYDVKDWQTIDQNQLGRVRGYFAYDAIALPNEHLLVIGRDGFYQYKIEADKDLREISKIEVQRD